MRTDVNFTVSTEPATVGHHRRGWTPAPDAGLAGMWIGAVVEDRDGQTFFGLRGADDFLVGMTHVVAPVTGFKRLPQSMNPQPPHLFPEYATIDWFEPMTYTDNAGAATLGFDSGRIERDTNGLHWYDATGRWELHAHPISDVFTMHVPAQDDIADQAYYRHELMSATGIVNGTSVSGYLHQDFAYGPPGMVYPQLPIGRRLQGLWVSWVHQFDDGQWGGGCFWQGRNGLSFGPGYHVVNGVTTAHDAVEATTLFNEAGQVVALTATIGGDAYEFTFDTAGSYIHFFGRLTAHPSGRVPARSWCWVEYAGSMLTAEALDTVLSKSELARRR